MFEESVDGLRTMLALSGPLQGMQVLTVTSAASREGKTSVASQLAVSIARSTGQMTLLIDADTRAPDQHDIFEVPLEPGLAKVLSHQCTLQEAAVPSSNDRLHILPAGKLQMNPHKLVGNGALSALLEEARATYRYIIIDTPPILAASESLVWAKAADASVVCAMRDVSRVDQIRIVCRRLVDADAPVVGVVINGVPPRKYAYSYGYYGYKRD